MFAGRLTQATLRALDWLAARTLSPEDIPAAPAHRPARRGRRLFLSSPARLHDHRAQLPLSASSRRTRSGRLGAGRPVFYRSEDSDASVTSSPPKPRWIAINKESCRWLPATSCARCPRRASGGLTCSPYTMSTDTATPHSSCFKMRFPYRTIVVLQIWFCGFLLKGFSTCLN